MLPQLPKLEPGQAVHDVLAGPAGALEIRLEMPKQAPQGLVLICHPHPLYGGTMDNKVVYSLSRAALAQNCISLRFNFRGVGQTQGSHDKGAGEQQDVAFLLRALSRQWPDLPLMLCGFSFGAYMALAVAANDAAVRALVTIAPPLAYAGSGDVPQPSCDWLVIHGTADDVVSFDETRQRAQAMSQPPEWVTVDGAGHFFHGQLGDLRAHVEPWLQARLS